LSGLHLDRAEDASPNPSAGAGAPPAPLAPPIGSRRERKKERTRREIYSAAMALFSEHGFDKVTIEQVCAQADVAKATFFLHFPAKSALLLEFARAMAAEFAQQLSGERGSAVDELKRLIELLAEHWLADAEVMFAMLREFLATPGSIPTSEEASEDLGGRELEELIEAIVRRGQQRGELRPGIAPRLGAALILSTALAILSGAVFEPGGVSPEAVQQQFFEVVLHGLVTDHGAKA